MAMRIECPKCRYENRDGVKFCEECGGKLECVCPSYGIVVPVGRKFRGELDVMTSVKYANYLGDRIANSKVVVVPEAGHFVFAEKPGVVNKAIEDFLKGISS